jgi:hypothetical protein
VVLPWSTCAMMAMLRIPELKGILPEFVDLRTLRRSHQRVREGHGFQPCR